MAKKNGIPQSTVTEALDSVLPQDGSFDVKAQRSFIKIVGPGKQRVYVSTAKDVRQVDLSFTLPENHGWESVIPVRRENGRVQAELDTDHPSFLDDLKGVINWMKTAAPEAAEERPGRFVPKLPIIAQRAAAAAADEAIPVLAPAEGEQRVEADDIRD
jgi:hypothetical protein